MEGVGVGEYGVTTAEVCRLNAEMFTKIWFPANEEPQWVSVNLHEADIQLHLWQQKSANKMWYRLNNSLVLAEG
jgi:hypothetical protein